MLLADLNLGDVLWSMIALFFFVIWLWIIFGIITDIFRSKDLSGAVKAIWVIFLVFLPFLAVLVYLIARGHGMSERALQAHADAQKQFDAYVRQTAGVSTGPAGEIQSAKELLDSGAITQEEFDRIKSQALA